MAWECEEDEWGFNKKGFIQEEGENKLHGIGSIIKSSAFSNELSNHMFRTPKFN